MGKGWGSDGLGGRVSGIGIYTIIDLHEKVRGTENLIFGSGAETDEQCAEMIDRLSATDNPTEVSHRNRIPCVVVRMES